MIIAIICFIVFLGLGLGLYMWNKSRAVVTQPAAAVSVDPEEEAAKALERAGNDWFFERFE